MIIGEISPIFLEENMEKSNSKNEKETLLLRALKEQNKLLESQNKLLQALVNEEKNRTESFENTMASLIETLKWLR